MADDAAPSVAPANETEAQKRARARREKILSRGGDRLAKITSTGRGDEAKLWDTTSPAQRSKPARPQPVASGDPDDVDLSTLAPAGMPDNPLQALMQGNAFSDRFAGTESPGPAPDMNDIFAQMLGGGAGGPGGQGGGNPLLAQMMAGAAGQQGQGPVQPPRPRTWLDRLVPLVHLIAMFALAAVAVFVLEPKRRAESLGLQRAVSGAVGEDGVTAWHAWAALIGDGKRRLVGERVWDSVMAGGLAEVPLFYFFVTVELVLQSAHIFLTRNAPPPGLLNTILPYLPPPLPMYASTAIRYWALIGTLLDDFAVLLFSTGLLVLLAEWRSGA